MSKASQIIVLCEDRAHENFVLRFLLKGWGVKKRSIRIKPYPEARGSGKDFVQDNAQEEANEYRRRYSKTILIIVRDADEETVASAQASLDKRIGQRKKDDKIVYVIPKWHIETWLAYLDNEQCDETDKKTYKDKYGCKARTKTAHPLIDRLAKWCRNRVALESPPESLDMACAEFERIRDVLKK